MADELGTETREEMRSLCKKISVAHNLDAEIQEELYAHMEDKLIAYLNGEEHLAEKDAFILVREHFGKPAVVKGLLQDAHKYEANVSLARRLAIALIVSTGIGHVVFCLMLVATHWWPAARGFGGFHASLTAFSVFTVVFPGLILWRWQRRFEAGHTPWCLKWPPRKCARRRGPSEIPRSPCKSRCGRPHSHRDAAS